MLTLIKRLKYHLKSFFLAQVDQSVILKNPEGEKKEEDANNHNHNNNTNDNNNSNNESNNSNTVNNNSNNSDADNNGEDVNKEAEKDKDAPTNGTIMTVPPLLEENIPVTISQCVSKVKYSCRISFLKKGHLLKIDRFVSRGSVPNNPLRVVI